MLGYCKAIQYNRIQIIDLFRSFCCHNNVYPIEIIRKLKSETTDGCSWTKMKMKRITSVYGFSLNGVWRKSNCVILFLETQLFSITLERFFLYWVILEPLGLRATLKLVCFIRPVARHIHAKTQLKPLFSKAHSHIKYTAVICKCAVAVITRHHLRTTTLYPTVHRIYSVKDLCVAEWKCAAAYNQRSLWD